jgi:hypothetical protein
MSEQRSDEGTEDSSCSCPEWRGKMARERLRPSKARRLARRGPAVCLTNAQVEQIQEEIQAAFAAGPLPDPVAWLEDYARHFATGAATPGCPSPVTPGQVVAVAAYHPQVWDALLQVIRRLIRRPVRWVGFRVCHLAGNELHQWAASEEEACASLLLHALVRNCDCWQRWQDFRIQNQALALHHCVTQHRLQAWDGVTLLQEFLFGGVVHGHLRLPEHGQGEMAYVNDFRRGMLAKVVADQELMAGRVLRCNGTGCGGEIQCSDACDACGQLSRVKQPCWWLWRREQRCPAHCRRCLLTHHGCDHLYFQYQGPCPNCGQSAWNPCPTEVWVPVAWVSLDERTGPGDGGTGPLDQLLEAEQREQLHQWLDGMADPVERAIIRGLFLEGRPLSEVAAQQELDPQSQDFRRLARQAVRQVPPGLLPPSWHGAEDGEES